MATKIVTANLQRGMSWDATKRALLQILSRNPGAIGLQEIYGKKKQLVKEFLAQHGYAVSLAEDVPIAYDASKYRLQDSGSVRLPGPNEGPKNPSRFGNWVALVDKNGGQVHVLTNTHLDHNRPAIHAQQVQALASLQRQLQSQYGNSASYYLTGDMNTKSRQDLHALLRGTGLETEQQHGLDWTLSSEGLVGQSRMNVGSDHQTVIARYGQGGDTGYHGGGGGVTMARNTGNGGGRGNGGGGNGKKDTINQKQIEEEYGLSYSLFKSDPELTKLLKDAVANSWSASRFQVELRQTDWFKTHSDTWRQAQALRYSDPATYQERLGASLEAVQNLAGQFGASLSKQALNRLAGRALNLGWNTDQIRDALANHVIPSKSGGYGGDLSSIQTQLASTAMNNGVRVGDDQMQRWMRQIVRGNASQSQYEQYIRDIASKTFGAYGDQIKAGMDMSDIASPYVQSMSQILEMNPQQINMFDPTIRRALSYKNAKGEEVPMSITDFEDSLRQDKRWQYTKQAQDSARGLAAAISNAWGLS